MADQRQDRAGRPGAGEREEPTVDVLNEDASGRAIPVERSSEEAMMQMGPPDTATVTPADETDQARTLDEIDDRAADDARMEVRRRERAAE